MVVLIERTQSGWGCSWQGPLGCLGEGGRDSPRSPPNTVELSSSHCEGLAGFRSRLELPIELNVGLPRPQVQPWELHNSILNLINPLKAQHSRSRQEVELLHLVGLVKTLIVGNLLHRPFQSLLSSAPRADPHIPRFIILC